MPPFVPNPRLAAAATAPFLALWLTACGVLGEPAPVAPPAPLPPPRDPVAELSALAKDNGVLAALKARDAKALSALAELALAGGKECAPGIADCSFSAAAEVLQADSDFALLASKVGNRAAFEAYMDPVDGWMIWPGKVLEGKAGVAEAFAKEDPTARYIWAPDKALASASGDLAMTSGRSTYQVKGKTVSKGRYVSIWRRNDKGEWKVVMDLGVPDGPNPPAQPQAGAKKP